jgi:hypothetical protein
MEIIELLKQQHEEVKKLFREIEQSPDRMEAENVLVQIIDKLQLHTTIEEKIFYPEIKAAGGDPEEVEHAFEEHGEVKEMIEKLLSEPPEAEMKMLVKKLIESVEHHVEEEEGEDGLFAIAREVFDQRELREEAKQARVIQSQFNNGDIAPV